MDHLFCRDSTAWTGWGTVQLCVCATMCHTWKCGLALLIGKWLQLLCKSLFLFTGKKLRLPLALKSNCNILDDPQMWEIALLSETLECPCLNLLFKSYGLVEGHVDKSSSGPNRQKEMVIWNPGNLEAVSEHSCQAAAWFHMPTAFPVLPSCLPCFINSALAAWPRPAGLPKSCCILLTAYDFWTVCCCDCHTLSLKHMAHGDTNYSSMQLSMIDFLHTNCRYYLWLLRLVWSNPGSRENPLLWEVPGMLGFFGSIRKAKDAVRLFSIQQKCYQAGLERKEWQ